MKYDRARHHRRSIRLRDFDYAASASYFITLCTYQRECIFGKVVDDHIVLGPYGEIVREEWERSAVVRPGFVLDAFVIMPNHLHGIVAMTPTGSVGAHSCAPLQRQPRSLASFVAQFKATATRRINVTRHTPGAPVWQRNYYEHVIRDEDDYLRILPYIEDNPRRWSEDEYNPALT